MKATSKYKTISSRRVFICLIVIAIVAGVPLLACAFARSAPSATVTIANSSDWTFQHVYFSATDQDNWGPDQLNGAVISPGSSRDLTVSCGSQVKVITEDQNGCFLYHVASCTDSSTWTVTNSATPDCGH